MPKFMDLSGQRYGHLTVIERDTSKKGATYWKCRCDCGKIKSVRAGDMRSGKTISCGCANGVKPKDITGNRYGMLVAIKRDEKRSTNASGSYWICKCDCGRATSVRIGDLGSGNTKSCGCRERMKHNMSYSRLYGVWESMKQRCNNPNCDHYDVYGGRGIKVCDEWNNDFSAFQLWAEANGYDSDAPHGKCTLDRINNNGNYEPSNCRWVDMKTQASNRRTSKRGKA